MASAPQASPLPLFYKDLMPLNSRDHAAWSSRITENATWMVGQHAMWRLPCIRQQQTDLLRAHAVADDHDHVFDLAAAGLAQGDA